MSKEPQAEVKEFKVKLPIGFKLVSMMALMLVTSTLLVVFLATKLFSDDNTAFIQKATSDVAGQLANQTYEYLGTLVNVVTTITEIQTQNLDAARKSTAQHLQFKRNSELIAVMTWRKGGLSAERQSFASDKSKNEKIINSIKPSNKSWSGDIDIQRVTVAGQSYLTLSFPLAVDDKKNVVTAAVGIVDQTKFLQIYGKKGVVTSYLVDREGNVLAHPKETLVSSGANLKDVEIVKAMLESPVNNNQLRFLDQDSKYYLGAFRQVGVAGVGVISQVLEEKAFETANRVKYRSLLVAGVILCLAFAAVYFFSTTLTKPIKLLVELTRQIAAGDFNIKVKPKGHDEITALTHSFGKMATGLAERDKLKETFNKFHSKEIAEAILSGEIKLGGTRQKATVFFSDIRGFTSISEGLEAEQVVEMLNEYMTSMVSVITQHKGVVDKYVGDAIMAVWGAPVPKPNDTWNAVSACIAMRVQLVVFNDARMAKGKKPIKIGMGLHYGELIAGNIGSTEKMEYTVIGDTVNTASRVESLTKEYGTDLLISDAVYQQVKNKLIVEPITSKVKGKADALKAFKVRGYIDESGKEIIVETAYSTYQSEQSDKVVHDKKEAA
ncbi:MAG: adenylate/guanylate cyclase domain-containing protein [Oligoflexia bacterium]|nr:adenylate/guanylate cyclase domain-containing protein [Oligoflexia bacterium]